MHIFFQHVELFRLDMTFILGVFMENYQILHLIGEGCFGKVFKGRRKYSGQAVALKFISTRGKTEKDLKNLRQEMSILRTLNHENIILLIDAFETVSDFVVVTEYAHGELFEVFQDDRRLPESEVQLIAQQLVKALHYLHSNRVIHRDMKPQNILIGSNNIIKIADFGFARSMSNQTTVLNSVKGTPLYMSPELVQEQPYNHTVDLWSLGVILYELFVGTPPFYTNSLYSLINLIINDSVKYPDNMSPEFKSFLQGLLQKNPSKRLDWPNLLSHPFISTTPKLVAPSPALSTAVCTPRNDSARSIILRDIERGFDAKKPLPVNQDIANECVSVIKMCGDSGQISPDFFAIVEYLVPFLQQMGDQLGTGIPQTSINPVFNILMNESVSCLLSMIRVMETSDSSVDDILRLFGLWLREVTASSSPVSMGIKDREQILSKFLKLANVLIKSKNSITNVCKCLCIVFPNLSVSQVQPFKLVHQIVLSLLTLVMACPPETVDKTTRAVIHALSASLLIAPDQAPNHPFPWSVPSSGTSQVSINPAALGSIVSIAKSNPKQFVSILKSHWLITSSSSTSPRHAQGNVCDPSAIHLLYSVLSEGSSDEFIKELTSSFKDPLTDPLILTAMPTMGRMQMISDVPSRCQACAILFLCLADKGPLDWMTADSIRGFANSLAHPVRGEPINPWVQSYSLRLLTQVVRVVSPTNSSSFSRLRESLLSLVQSVNSECVRNWSIFSNISELRNIEGRISGNLINGPLDGYLSICNLVNELCDSGSGSACRRLVRGLLSISPNGIRGLLSLCGPSGLFELAECLSVALTTSSNDKTTDQQTSRMIREILAVLQSLVALVEQTGKSVRAGYTFNSLLGTMLYLCQDEGVPPDVADAMASGHVVPGLVNAVTGPFGPSKSVLGVLALIIQTSSAAASQFVAAKGLEMLRTLRGNDELAGEVVSIVSNIARTSSENYPHIHERLSPYSDFGRILTSPNIEGSVKAKVCNCIGNMARHSDFFYPHLTSLIPSLISACLSEDTNCRKFASFALGNIAFHSGSLYGELRVSVPVLVELLSDGDEKTRSNSAGALGNLVRNSSALVSTMITRGAVEGLLSLVKSGNLDSSGRIALFSLGNLAMHSASKEVLTRLRCQAIVERILRNAKNNRDMQTIKYCDRLTSKLSNSSYQKVN
jgi:hypothetical protein